MEVVMKSEFVLALLVVSSELSAQNVTGTWKVTYDSDMTRASGEWKARKRSEAPLELTQRGDSVFGVWHRSGDQPCPAGDCNGQPVRGTLKGVALTLTTGANTRTVLENGKPVTATVRLDFTGTVSANRIVGVMFIRMGDREPPARRWEATRQ